MKVIAINGSPRAKGNTYHSLKVLGDELMAQGIDFEILHIGHKAIHGCIGCGKCAEKRNQTCPSFPDDAVSESVQKMKQADGIVLASPVYYAGVAGTMKCFIDRAFYVAGSNSGLFRHKVGAAITVQRRTGGSSSLDCLNHYFTISEMPLAGSTYWNAIHGGAPGEVLQDEEGVQTLRNLARNMAWMIKMRQQTKDSLPVPDTQKVVRTNFIR